MTTQPEPVPSERRIELLPLHNIVSAPTNPRRHAADATDRSLTRFGFIDPLVRDDRTGALVAGHGRVESLLRLFDADPLSPPAGIQLIDDPLDWLVPVAVGWASRGEVDAKAAALALNRTDQLGGWAAGTLISLLDSVEAAFGADGVTDTGYSAAELEALRNAAQLEADTAPAPELDWAPATVYPPDTSAPRTRPADDPDAERTPSVDPRAARNIIDGSAELDPNGAGIKSGVGAPGTIRDKEADYRASDTRMLVLDFDMAEADELATLLASARALLGTANDPETVLTVLRGALPQAAEVAS